ncbi:ERCC4 domain-containing protein [Clostridium algidicarnis]|uniref:ERCC4 domain-containing protein n=1 Tax=Clostridium algidicarnis TaxID=37659 RepID=UPI001C0CB746|nr:ERCC4 domain-containing protein [Clostridium algidicarnis]MBU3193487.1 ERCC4 domain-containing protein [Clostridium algidicarnis]MBU3203107.1 ERCC4 domain-containing protein [Clostridium algidicarnis]MBU3205595.1 ERCC4 domain-containing protein [Clostridium algidicarnis]MBU3208709.1 ERCC4 domain-containing protein [Clostridium algidicarnis]MBU3211261.1 ERCC4 domain-containing protein [Clostridium algidicarnis]
MQLRYNFTDTEIKKLLKENVVIIADTREQQNQHILDYFDKVKVKCISKKIDAGDYSIKLTAREDMGIYRDIYFPISIEKKNSVDELAASIKDRTRFENEFIRAKGSGTKIHLLVEDTNGYENILTGNYRSLYESKAFMASLKTFESRYNFVTTYLDKKYSGDFIYRTLLYELREFLLK